jgi:thiosulfate dehydrogenase
MFKGFISGVIFTVALALAGGYFILRSGMIAANADARPGPIEKFVARTALDATLRNEAPTGANPVAATDANLMAGIKLYGTHCAICHGTAAGKASATPIAKGENPSPPQLASDGVKDDPEGWTFWKVKHGIRWTGMPSWKAELNDQQIWTLALFLKRMDKLPLAPAAAWRALRLNTAATTASGSPESAIPGTDPAISSVTAPGGAPAGAPAGGGQ